MDKRTRRRAQLGFTYLGLLFFVAISAAALAALGQRWSTAVQRDKERELEFRGQEIARAIDSYLKAGQQVRPKQPPAYPASLDDLLEDRRGVRPLHHLRRAYVDPFTGKPDWVLVPVTGRNLAFQSLHSRSDQPLLRRLGDADKPTRASDWVFEAGLAAARPDPAASAASQPGR